MEQIIIVMSGTFAITINEIGKNCDLFFCHLKDLIIHVITHMLPRTVCKVWRAVVHMMHN